MFFTTPAVLPRTSSVHASSRVDLELNILMLSQMI